jgi:TonB family protein
VFAFQLRDHKVLAIGPSGLARGKEAKLPTLFPLPPAFADSFTPPANVSAAIDRSGGEEEIALLSCSDGKSAVTSRVVTASRYPDFDRSALEFAAKVKVPDDEFLYQGRHVAACIVWKLSYRFHLHSSGQDGVLNGEANGVGGGGEPESPPPPRTHQPWILPAAELEVLRIAGDKVIAPDPTTKARIEAGKPGSVVATVKLCVAADGSVSDARLLKPTGYKAYDEKLVTVMMKSWRYKPFMVNGNAEPVCTTVMFVYRAQTPSPK